MEQPTDLLKFQWVTILLLCGVISALVKVFWGKLENRDLEIRRLIDDKHAAITAKDAEIKLLHQQFREAERKTQEIQDLRDKEREEKLMTIAQGGAAERKAMTDFLAENHTVLNSILKRLPAKGGKPG